MIVYNGQRYNELYDVWFPDSAIMFMNNALGQYQYTVCIKNAYVAHYTESGNHYYRVVTGGTFADNVLWYNKEKKEVVTTDILKDMLPDLLDYNGYNYFNGLDIINFERYKNIVTINAEFVLNSVISGNSGSHFNTTIFNKSLYPNYSSVFNGLYISDVYMGSGVRNNNWIVKSEFYSSNLFDTYATVTDMRTGLSLWAKNSCIKGRPIYISDYTVLAVDWTVYIDGTYNPTIKITWDSEYMNFDEMGNTFDASKAFIGYGSESPFSVEWQSGSYTTSYKEVVKILYPSIYEKIIEGVGSLLDAPSFSIRLLGATLNGGFQVNSGTCFFVMSAKGTVSESGLAEGSEGLSDTITIVYGNDETGGSDEDSDDPSENDNPSEGEEISVKGFNLLTLTYALTPNRLAQLGSFIWGASFLTNLKLVNNNPIENIVSCKMFPFTVTGGADTSIKLGNVETGINGNPVSSGGYSAKKVINGFTIAPLFNNFLDYEPYTKISVFLPFIGIKELQPSQIMNKLLSLEYVVDIVTGICKCIVKSGGKQIADYDGSIGIDIPITSSNRAQVELSYITSALGVVGSIAMGSPLGVVGSVLSGASSSYHSETKGTSSPITGVYGALTPFVIFDRPKYTLPSAYGRTKGFVCNKTCTISSLSGFTVCHENVKLNGISCTNEELEEIKSLLISGFFA